MKRMIAGILAALLLLSAAWAETAREYAAWLEEVLPGAAFSDADVPDFVIRLLGADYDFIARTDEKYGSYIAGVRREDAPKLPEDIHIFYRGSFENASFHAQDSSGNVIYEFILGEGVQLQEFDKLQHIIIHADASLQDFTPFAPAGSLIFRAAGAQSRAQLIYGTQHGFSPEDQSRPQLSIPVHSISTWRAGATDQPHHFYLNVELPADLLGAHRLDLQQLSSYTAIPIGIYLMENGRSWELMVSDTGAKGLFRDGILYEAGPGFDRLLDAAEAVLGYCPGDRSFIGKESVRAVLEWTGGSAEITDTALLKKLDAMLRGADFTIGSVNCPSPCFLTLEYAGGGSASMAVAVNSFNLFFYNGLYFTAGDGELLEIFNLNMEDIL